MKKEDSTADVLFSFWLYMDNPLELFCTALSCADSTKKTPSRNFLKDLGGFFVLLY